MLVCSDCTAERTGHISLLKIGIRTVTKVLQFSCRREKHITINEVIFPSLTTSSIEIVIVSYIVRKVPISY